MALEGISVEEAPSILFVAVRPCTVPLYLSRCEARYFCEKEEHRCEPLRCNATKQSTTFAERIVANSK